MCAPLPAGWEEEERADGTPLYRHESGQLSDHHPLEEHYRAVVSGLRDRPSPPASAGHGKSQCLRTPFPKHPNPHKPQRAL